MKDADILNREYTYCIAGRICDSTRISSSIPMMVSIFDEFYSCHGLSTNVVATLYTILIQSLTRFFLSRRWEYQTGNQWWRQLWEQELELMNNTNSSFVYVFPSFPSILASLFYSVSLCLFNPFVAISILRSIVFTSSLSFSFIILSITGLCYEKRVFYRLISGFHSAITISIASYNYKPR